ncbi:MAG: hypothetical protein R2874_10895 [Desulfobacterales bacterium]
MGISEFLATAGAIRVLADLGLIGIFGGFYIVPLFAFVQMRTQAAFRARVIAANNILNALLMVVSTLIGIVVLGILKLSIPEFFLIIAAMNVVVAIFIYTVVPEFLFGSSSESKSILFFGRKLTTDKSIDEIKTAVKKLSKGILFGESPLLLGSGGGSFFNLQKRTQADHGTHSAPEIPFI